MADADSRAQQERESVRISSLSGILSYLQQSFSKLNDQVQQLSTYLSFLHGVPRLLNTGFLHAIGTAGMGFGGRFGGASHFLGGLMGQGGSGGGKNWVPGALQEYARYQAGKKALQAQAPSAEGGGGDWVPKALADYRRYVEGKQAINQQAQSGSKSGDPGDNKWSEYQKTKFFLSRATHHFAKGGANNKEEAARAAKEDLDYMLAAVSGNLPKSAPVGMSPIATGLKDTAAYDRARAKDRVVGLDVEYVLNKNDPTNHGPIFQYGAFPASSQGIGKGVQGFVGYSPTELQTLEQAYPGGLEETAKVMGMSPDQLRSIITLGPGEESGKTLADGRKVVPLIQALDELREILKDQVVTGHKVVDSDLAVLNQRAAKAGQPAVWTGDNKDDVIEGMDIAKKRYGLDSKTGKDLNQLTNAVLGSLLGKDPGSPEVAQASQTLWSQLGPRQGSGPRGNDRHDASGDALLSLLAFAHTAGLKQVVNQLLGSPVEEASAAGTDMQGPPEPPVLLDLAKPDRRPARVTRGGRNWASMNQDGQHPLVPFSGPRGMTGPSGEINNNLWGGGKGRTPIDEFSGNWTPGRPAPSGPSRFGSALVSGAGAATKAFHVVGAVGMAVAKSFGMIIQNAARFLSAILNVTQHGSPDTVKTFTRSFNMVLAQLAGAFVPMLARASVALIDFADTLSKNQDRVWRFGNAAATGLDSSGSVLGGYGKALNKMLFGEEEEQGPKTEAEKEKKVHKNLGTFAQIAGSLGFGLPGLAMGTIFKMDKEEAGHAKMTGGGMLKTIGGFLGWDAMEKAGEDLDKEGFKEATNQHTPEEKDKAKAKALRAIQMAALPSLKNAPAYTGLDETYKKMQLEMLAQDPAEKEMQKIQIANAIKLMEQLVKTAEKMGVDLGEGKALIPVIAGAR